MFEIWLDTDCNATWDKIYKAIECPGVTKANLNFQLNDGKREKYIVRSMVCMCIISKEVNIYICIKQKMNS